MTLFILRMKNGDCLITSADDERSAVEIGKRMGLQSELASVRPLTHFVAQFTLTTTGQLRSTHFDSQTISELGVEYPILEAARASSNVVVAKKGNTSEPAHPLQEWEQHDKDLIACAVQQERQRLSN